jgi:hypothetical protein
VLEKMPVVVADALDGSSHASAASARSLEKVQAVIADALA